MNELTTAALFFLVTGTFTAVALLSLVSIRGSQWKAAIIAINEKPILGSSL